MMTEEEFWNWYDKDIFKPYGGFMPHENWPKDVENSHKKLREFLGGPYRIEKFPLQDYQYQLDTTTINHFYGLVRKYLPDYFASYGFNANILKFPVIQNGEFEGQKVTRHIQFYANKMKLAPEKKNEFAKILSNLGQAWNKARTTKQDIEVCITTTPQAFAMLGHYHSDSIRNSCFRNGGGHQKDKYYLGQLENSFVALVGKNLENTTPGNVGVYSRMWGMANDDLDTFYLSNIYVADDNFQECYGNVYKSLDMFFDKILPGDKLKRESGKVIVSGIYKNHEDLCYTKKNELEKGSFAISPKYGLEKQRPCIMCRKYYRRIEEVEGQIYCCNCSSSFRICDISGAKTSSGMDVKDENGKDRYISAKIVARDFKMCERTGQYWPRKSIVYAGPSYGWINIFEATKLGLIKCDKCTHHSMNSATGECAYCGFQQKDKSSVEININPSKTSTTTYTKRPKYSSIYSYYNESF